MDRREFLKYAGGTCLLGIGGKIIFSVFSKEGFASSEGEGKGKSYAMVIDVRRCIQFGETCNQCMVACHRAHNVPYFDNPKDEIKWIWKERYEHAFLDQENRYVDDGLKGRSIPVLCNHCENPPCVRVCPTKATWKREDGIVMMDWHRCIGCRYCVAACPYGSRSFNWKDPRTVMKELNPEFPTRTKGVVEKCTFCEERLYSGRNPACAEACPAKAIIFGDLSDPQSDVRRLLKQRFSIRRKPALGTDPKVFYLV